MAFVYQNLAIYNSVMYGLPGFGDPAFRSFPTAPLAMKQRHGGRWNIVFCDGHVKSLRPVDLFNFYDPMMARRWNISHQPYNLGWRPPPP